MSRFEIFKGKDGKWYFRLKARNGKVVASGEGYSSKSNCRRGAYCVADCIDGRLIQIVEI